VPVAFLLLPPIQHHGDAEDQNGVEADNAKGCGEDEVQVLVRERGERADAAALLRGDERVDASVILDEGRRSRIKVSAAIKLGSVSAVFGIASASGRWNACAGWLASTAALHV
jgi:microcompartment protein CcmK/EutM